LSPDQSSGYRRIGRLSVHDIETGRACPLPDRVKGTFPGLKVSTECLPRDVGLLKRVGPNSAAMDPEMHYSPDFASSPWFETLLRGSQRAVGL
jgi:hypothetical protein